MPARRPPRPRPFFLRPTIAKLRVLPTFPTSPSLFDTGPSAAGLSADPLSQWLALLAAGIPVAGVSAPWLGATPTPPPQFQGGTSRPGCGFVRVGREEIPVDCLTPDYGAVRTALAPMFPTDALRLSPDYAGAAELPMEVDHRKDDAEGPMRNQEHVGACSAFSFAGAIDQAIAQTTGVPGRVSVMHVWSRYHEPSMTLPAERNLNQPLTVEEAWPYNEPNEQQACRWVRTKFCEPNCSTQGGTCGCTEAAAPECNRPVDQLALRQADENPLYRVTEVIGLQAYKEPFRKDRFMEALAKGQDLWISIAFCYGAFDYDALLEERDGLRFVVPYFGREQVTSAHAMTIAGYTVRPGGTYFLLRNSWGEEWGDHGYAWVHEKTLAENLQSAYIVHAELWDPRANPTPPRQVTPSQCPSSLRPDSISGQCVPPCPDGSPRHDGACPDLSDCPSGYVNLDGHCAVAAPVERGVDPGTGIAYDCAAGGCAYAVPYGPYCPIATCTASCPSPRFRLALSPSGFTCSE